MSDTKHDELRKGGWSYPKSGGGLPEGGEPYQQLVTDGDGKTVWEERLAYTTVRESEFFSASQVDFQANPDVTDMQVCAAELYDAYSLQDGASYRLMIDGEYFDDETYLCTSAQYVGAYIGDGGIMWGDYSQYADGTRGFFVNSNGIILVNYEPGVHDVTIREYTSIDVPLETRYIPDEVIVGKRYNGGTGEVFNHYDNTASGEYSHAEGDGTNATGGASHAEGSHSFAEGYASHADGINNVAYGRGSHVSGHANRAYGEYQFVIGKCNKYDEDGEYVFIVGNGKTYDGSNAHTLDWSGNARYAGTVEGKGMVVRSSTEGSTKRFLITVDDSGTLTATEVTE